MSLDEMENAWDHQVAQPPLADAESWLTQTERKARHGAWVITLCTMIALFNLGLPLLRLFTDPSRTITNSTWELVIPALALVIALMGNYLVVRHRRKYRTLRHDTRRCLESILQEKRHEITAMTLWLPGTFAGFLILIVLSKFQSIAAGFESPVNAWSGVVFAGLLFTVICAFLFHRANAFLKPEVEDLERTLRSLLAH